MGFVPLGLRVQKFDFDSGGPIQVLDTLYFGVWDSASQAPMVQCSLGILVFGRWGFRILDPRVHALDSGCWDLEAGD